MNLSIEQNDSGIVVNFNNEKFSLKYPTHIWSNFPDEMKDFFMDNYLFLKSVHLPLILNVNKIKLNTAPPLLKSFFLTMQFMDIPNISDFDDLQPDDLFKKFFNTSFKFNNGRVKYPNSNFVSNENSSVLSSSFGKDSLLSLALTREMNLDNHPVWIEEKGAPLENRYKRKLIKKFKEEFDINVEKIHNETILLHSYHYLKISDDRNYILSHLLTEYALLLIPFLYNYEAEYLFFGNEQSCNQSYMSKSGYKCYPVFDQSSEWMQEINKLLNISLGKKIHVSSLVEPLHDIAIIKILRNRYPKFAKYQYSCFPDETTVNNFKRWCCHCSKCARLFIIFKALNVNTKKLGFRNNMLSKKYMQYYSIFGSSENLSPYDSSGVGRDEQLLAFLLAAKNKVKGELIDEFKKRFMKEVENREDELRKKFFGIHKSFTIPRKIKNQLLSIYKEELSDLK
ncbi:MAG: hypothetical protein QMD36_04535 [Candidatus Aenigmarchaeota archaeon]|nr:hypothetical protein [Candidatus Aenigmarchaeota archaeon]